MHIFNSKKLSILEINTFYGYTKVILFIPAYSTFLKNNTDDMIN